MGVRMVAWSSVVLACLVGCGDLTDAVGDEGRIEVALATDYEVDGALNRVKLVTGHRQSFSVSLTSKGRADIPEPGKLTYRMAPTDGVTIEAVGGSTSQPPNISLLVTKPGDYKLRAISKGKEVDSLSLTFDSPVALELVVKIRAPWAEKFEDVSDTTMSVVDEGTQALFLPIPLDGQGTRLAGNIETRAEATPSDKVVSGSDVDGLYEQRVWTGSGKIELYFIDPGNVTVTVTDPTSKASGSHAFSVTNVGE